MFHGGLTVVAYRERMRTPRLAVGVLALLFIGLTVFPVFRSVSAASIDGGPTWTCGSVARPALPASSVLAQATPEGGRQTFVLDQVACSAARDRQLGSSLVALLPALLLTAIFLATGERRRSATPESAPIVLV